MHHELRPRTERTVENLSFGTFLKLSLTSSVQDSERLVREPTPPMKITEVLNIYIFTIGTARLLISHRLK